MPFELISSLSLFQFIIAPHFLIISMAMAISLHSLNPLIVVFPFIHRANAMALCASLLEQGASIVKSNEEIGLI